MNSPRTLILLFLVQLALFLTPASAQNSRNKKAKKQLTIYDVDTLINPVPKQRELFIYYVDKEQERADLYDGLKDGQISYEGDELYSRLLTQAILKDVNQLQVTIENLPYAATNAFVENNEKIGFHRSLEELVKRYLNEEKKDGLYYKKRVDNFKAFLIARHKNQLSPFFQEHADIYTFDNISLLDPKEAALKKELLMKLGEEEPKLMLRRFKDFAFEPYAGDILAPAAKVVPNEIYNFASSANQVYAGAIRRSKDPLMQTIVKIADQAKKPLQVMPFLADIHSGKRTIAEVDKIVVDPHLFFKSLVQLKLDNQQLGGNTYTSELQYRVNNRYIRKINELHDEPEAVRFKILEGLSPEELYFIMVYGQDEIYTSSFLGANKRMMERMGTMPGGELLEKVHYDKFRTYVRMSAGYNTLNAFLATMKPDAKTQLMRDFVDNLEKGREDDLEDAVDVADAYGSIDDPEMVAFMKQEVTRGYERSYQVRSSKGLKIYALLTTIFEGNKGNMSDAAAEEQSKLLNLPPINEVPFSKLANDAETVYQRVFFYGDEDGKTSYASFMGNFRDGKWKTENNKYFSTISSTSGKPVVIYANLPLTEPEDETAVEELDKYLKAESIHPTIIVHRGHSYHLPVTLDHLDDKVRIVVLGSCGGYHNLATVLDASPDAHIISSKQTGAMAVNDPIIRNINTTLLAGQSVDWIESWKQLGGYFADKSASDKKLFSDYVPPYKNLGAIFIKAYRRLSAQENL